MTAKLGHPDNKHTRRAPVDAILIAQAFYRNDEAALAVLLDNCDPYSVSLQLCGWLYTTFDQFDVNTERRLAIWLAAARHEIGEGTSDD